MYKYLSPDDDPYDYGYHRDTSIPSGDDKGNSKIVNIGGFGSDGNRQPSSSGYLPKGSVIILPDIPESRIPQAN